MRFLPAPHHLPIRYVAYAFAVLLFNAVNGWAQVSTDAPFPMPANHGVVRGALPIQPETYGTASQVKLQIAGASLAAFDAGNSKLEDGTGQFYSSSAGGRLGAGVDLPTGAQIQQMDLYYDDTDPSNDVAAFLFTMEGTTTNLLSQIAFVSSTGSAGKGVASIGVAHTVVNDNRQYMLYVNGSSSIRKVRAVAIIYKLQISPDPATATFTDVPVGHPFHRFVEALYASGITGGCGGGNYCPDAPVTRGQMAVFLAGALGLHWAP
jgi:hypothetical protein